MRNTLIKNASLLAVLAFVVCGGLMFSGCSSDDGTPGELIGTWLLQEFILGGGTTTAVDDPSKYTVEFKSDGTANIRADCNLCSGNYFVDGSSLRFGPLLACTLAQCPPGSLDRQYQAALSTTARYEITDGSLFLDYDGGELRFAP